MAITVTITNGTAITLDELIDIVPRSRAAAEVERLRCHAEAARKDDAKLEGAFVGCKYHGEFYDECIRHCGHAPCDWEYIDGGGNGKYVHSYSSLADWRLCPRLFKRKHLDKAYPFEETAATRRGNRLHKQMEDVFAKGGGIPIEWKGDERLIHLLKDHGARPEVKIGMTRDGRGCNFFDNKHVWLRGKIDLYKALSPQKAAIMIDWKSGNPNYTDEFQADVYTAMVSSATPLERSLFIWGYFSGEMPHKIVDGDLARKRVWKIAECVEADTEYAPTPCWKCRWCPVSECEYNTADR